MKFLLPVLALSLVGSLFAMDEYLPIKEKTLEVDAGYGYFAFTGMYDKDGEKQDIDDEFSPALSMIPIQIKYGIIPGLDVELMVPIAIKNKDANFPKDEGTGGLDRPSIGVKYAVPGVGAGGYVDFALPIGAEDIVGINPTMSLTFGGIYGLSTEMFNLLATVDYTLEFEDDDKWKDGNTLSFLVKPEYKPMEQLGIYAMAMFDLTSESSFDGEGMDDAGHLFTLQPGVNFAANEMVAFEAGVPLTLMGKYSDAFWGVFGNVYFTFGF